MQRINKSHINYYRSLFIFFYIVSINPLIGQGSLSGFVMDSTTHKPIELAHVFFANTLLGTTSNTKGEFIIQSIPPGKYDLLISFVGYKMIQKSVIIADGQNTTFNAYLVPNPIELNEVVVRADTSGWHQHYAEFKRLFIGSNQFAQTTSIENASVLRFYFDENERVLSAFAKTPLIIKNQALGFTIFYDLIHFQADFKSGKLLSFGVPRFEALPEGKPRTVKRWNASRLQSYHGSFSHLLKALQENRLRENGFDLYFLYKVVNRTRPSDSYLDERISYWRNKVRENHNNVSDSLGYYGRLKNESSIIDSIGAKINDGRVLMKEGSNHLDYHGSILVLYNQPEEPGYRYGRPLPYQKSIIHLLGNGLTLYDNGYYEDVRDLLLEGYMGWTEKISRMLPLEYLAAQRMR